MELIESTRWQDAPTPIRLAVARALILLCAGWHVDDVMRFLPELVGDGAAETLPAGIRAAFAATVDAEGGHAAAGPSHAELEQEQPPRQRHDAQRPAMSDRSSTSFIATIRMQ